MTPRSSSQEISQSDQNTGRTKIFYDGSCPLCRAEVGHYQNRDAKRHLNTVDVSAPDADLPHGLDRKSAMGRFHVMSPDGQLLSGAAAFVEVWKQVPGWRWAARTAGWPGVMPLLELGYRAFLPLRPAIVRVFVAMRRLRGQTAISDRS